MGTVNSIDSEIDEPAATRRCQAPPLAVNGRYRRALMAVLRTATLVPPAKVKAGRGLAAPGWADSAAFLAWNRHTWPGPAGLHAPVKERRAVVRHVVPRTVGDPARWLRSDACA